MILHFDIVTHSAQIALIIPRKQDKDFMSAYHFYGNFGENFQTNGTGIFVSHRKQARAVESCHLQNTGKIFGFSPKEAWNWLSTQIVVSVKARKR